MSAHRWLWRADVDRVVDGDTLDLVIDCGFHATRTERVRLLGVNCPEVKGASRDAGLAATSFTERWVFPYPRYDAPPELPPPPPNPWPFLVETFKTDAFGRYLARIWPADNPDSPDLSQALLDAGHAVPYLKG